MTLREQIRGELEQNLDRYYREGIKRGYEDSKAKLAKAEVELDRYIKEGKPEENINIVKEEIEVIRRIKEQYEKQIANNSVILKQPSS